MPLFKKIAENPQADAIKAEIEQSGVLIGGIRKLIHEYTAGKASLFELTHGTQIIIELPTFDDKIYALVTCYSYHGDLNPYYYDYTIKEALLAAHSDSWSMLSLDENFRAELAKDLAELKRKAKEFSNQQRSQAQPNQEKE